MSEEILFSPKTINLLIQQYYNIASQIQLQRDLIICKFNVKPQYILLGVETDRILKCYALSQSSNPSHVFVGISNDPAEAILKAYFDLTPIIDKSLPLKLPEDFIQVVVPKEAYS